MHGNCQFRVRLQGDSALVRGKGGEKVKGWDISNLWMNIGALDYC